jgi:threonine dehydratase
VHRTPLEASRWLSEASGARVSLKLECYQPTGSFKVRGALAAITQLDSETRARGVVTASAGNHGLGVAFASSRLGVDATVVVPDDASPAKVAALRQFPITLLTGGSGYDAAELEARKLARDTGATFVSPYNDLWVMAGQGTIGVELLEDMPDLDVLISPVGGGGLISGIGSLLKAVRPSVRVLGVQSEASPAMERALKTGRRVEVPILPTLADGLAANIEPESSTFDTARALVDEMILVSEEEIAAGIREAFHELHLALEGSAVVGIAALLGGYVGDLAGRNVAVMITGRNIAAERLIDLLRG